MAKVNRFVYQYSFIVTLVINSCLYMSFSFNDKYVIAAVSNREKNDNVSKCYYTQTTPTNTVSISTYYTHTVVFFET